MKKVVRSISFRRKRDLIKLVAYASSARGTRIVDGVVDIDTAGKDKKQVNTEVKDGLAHLLRNQPDSGSVSISLPGLGE